MKKGFALACLAGVLMLAGCQDPTTSTGGISIPPSTTTSSTPISSSTEDKEEITIAELKSKMPTTDNTVSKERYYVRATIVSIDNPQYGQMTIKDATGSISVYGTYNETGEKRYSEMDEVPYAGYEVLLYANVKNFGGEAEINSGWIIEFKEGEKPDVEDYEVMTLAKARTVKKDTLVNVTGKVARITYAMGMKPNGFMLVGDNSSMYVYDSQLAPRVEIGNTINILAKKDYFIAPDVQTDATRYGYTGANQLKECVLMSNDEKTGTLDYSFAAANTVKGIMDTGFNQDITGEIYKVNALITKKQESNFVNYYINDLDGTTGTYVYTQASGGDFSWLDQYDGQLRTLYVTALNAKVSSSGCVWRFLPLAVEDEAYTFNVADAPKFVVDYYGLRDIDTVYTGDPAVEVVTKVDSALLGFTGATIEYSSSNTAVMDFAQENGKLVLHTKGENYGKSTITVTGKLAGQTDYSTTIEVEYKEPIKYDYVTVKEAIDTPFNAETPAEIYVRGVVGPSLVNQSGFYLIDETGAIAVRMNSKTDLALLKQGETVIMKGLRNRWGKLSSEYLPHSQECLSHATIALNEYGSTAYSTASFITDKTLEDLKAYEAENVELTANVYVLKAEFVKGMKQEGAGNTPGSLFWTNKTTNVETEIQLYASGPDQYNWMNEFSEQGELTMEIALCNWNSKSAFKACVLSVTNAAGVKTINSLNF